MDYNAVREGSGIQHVSLQSRHGVRNRHPMAHVSKVARHQYGGITGIALQLLG